MEVVGLKVSRFGTLWLQSLGVRGFGNCGCSPTSLSTRPRESAWGGGGAHRTPTEPNASLESRDGRINCITLKHKLEDPTTI